MRDLRGFWQDEDGATSIEYVLLGTLIAIAVVAVVTGIGTKLSASFSQVSGAFK